MGTKYSNNLPTGYNVSPPSDDGATTAANKVQWSTIKTKLTDCFNTWAASLNTAILNAFDTSCTSLTGNYTTLASDNARTLQCSGTFTVSLGDASTLAAGWFCNIVNAGTGTITIGRATGGNTLAGVASNITLAPLQATTVIVNQAANGFNLLDCNSLLLDNTDTTKQLRFDISQVPSGSTLALKSPSAAGTLVIGADTSGKPLINDYLTGFSLTNNGTTAFDVAAGFSSDSTNAVVLNGSALASKNQNSWAAGAAAGAKLSAAAMANNTWYYWFAIWKTADGTVDYGFDVSTTPTLPSGYSKYRYIGARKTALAATTWDTFIQHGDEVWWSTPPALDLNGNPSTANRTLTTMNIPAVRVKWFGRVQSIVGGTAFMGVVLSDPLVADTAPGNIVTPLADWGFATAGAVTNLAPSWQLTCWANAASQIGVRSSAANSTQIQTLGWIDPRGRPV